MLGLSVGETLTSRKYLQRNRDGERVRKLHPLVLIGVSFGANLRALQSSKVVLGLTRVHSPLSCSLSTEELVSDSPTSAKEAKVPVAKTSTSPEGGPGPLSPCEENLMTPAEPPTEVTPSESSESISPVTQIAKPATAAEAPVLPKDLSQKLLEASLEEQGLAVDVGETGPPPPAQFKPHTPAGRPSGPEPRPPARVETLREEVLTDLRVFELNSDSGKSTPSNNGKKGKSRPKSQGAGGRGTSKSCYPIRQTCLFRIPEAFVVPVSSPFHL